MSSFTRATQGARAARTAQETPVAHPAQGLIRPFVRRIDRHLGGHLGRKLREADRARDALRRELADVRKELRKAHDRAHLVDLLLGSDGRRVNRQPTHRLIADLSDRIATVTGVGKDEARRATVHAYRTLVELENRGVGRIAGGTANIIGKLATTPLLSPPTGEILEIGTLYGLFAGGMARQILRTGTPYHLTIVDPISPVQLQDGAELGNDVSGTPISEAVVRGNLHYAGVEPARLRLHRGYSGDPVVRAALSDRQYGVIIVDGDHSQQGVTADLEWVERIAAPGAVIVMDDYGDSKWPGVQKATDEHLGGDTRLSMIGQVTTSGFLRAD